VSVAHLLVAPLHCEWLTNAHDGFILRDLRGRMVSITMRFDGLERA
jgi:hypothetical protein